MSLSAMATAGLRTPAVSLASKSDANKTLSSGQNLHGSLQTVYNFINSSRQHHAQKSMFPLAVKSTKIFEQTCSMSTSKLRVKTTRTSESDIETLPAPEIGVAVFILKDNKILLGRRRALFVAANSYGLPAGHLESGESYEECAAREVKEETGLDIKNIKVITANNLYYDNETHLNVTYLRAHLSDPNQTPQNIEPDKCEGWEWYDLNNLPEPMFGPLKEMLQGGFNPFHNVC